MFAKGITPILNVSDMSNSFVWFENLGWHKAWEWGEPVSFGCVQSWQVEIFLCLNGQGGRGRGQNSASFGHPEGETADKGVWLSIWVEQLDDLYQHCLSRDIEVLLAPEDMPWGVREMHVRHPDGHVFRLSQALACGASG